MCLSATMLHNNNQTKRSLTTVVFSFWLRLSWFSVHNWGGGEGVTVTLKAFSAQCLPSGSCCLTLFHTRHANPIRDIKHFKAVYLHSQILDKCIYYSSSVTSPKVITQLQDGWERLKAVRSSSRSHKVFPPLCFYFSSFCLCFALWLCLDFPASMQNKNWRSEFTVSMAHPLFLFHSSRFCFPTLFRLCFCPFFHHPTNALHGCFQADNWAAVLYNLCDTGACAHANCAVTLV